MSNMIPFGPRGPNLVKLRDQHGRQVNAALSDDVTKHLITCGAVVVGVWGAIWIATRKQ